MGYLKVELYYDNKYYFNANNLILFILKTRIQYEIFLVVVGSGCWHIHQDTWLWVINSWEEIGSQWKSFVMNETKLMLIM